jgi:hypothetical protein
VRANVGFIKKKIMSGRNISGFLFGLYNCYGKIFIFMKAKNGNKIFINPLFETYWKKLFDLYYKVDVSEEFIICANNQLDPIFRSVTSLNDYPARLSFEQEVPFQYEKGVISKISSRISLKYGFNTVDILWKSKSGRIYELQDTDIDCNDIEFWFEGLDPDLCYKAVYPEWSLITFPENVTYSFAVNISKQFIKCADKQLSVLFKKLTGISFNKHIGLFFQNDTFDYQKNDTSILLSSLSINHESNRLNVLWKSKSGRIYDIVDTDIDCDDIEFWFDKLDPLLCQKQMFPNEKLPFKLKNLTYELTVTRLNMDMTIEMTLHKGAPAKENEMITQVDNFIDGYNKKSEEKDRVNGVVHNWKREIKDEKLIYEIDTGSTGSHFLKQLLQFLSKLNYFEKVEVC